MRDILFYLQHMVLYILACGVQLLTLSPLISQQHHQIMKLSYTKPEIVFLISVQWWQPFQPSIKMQLLIMSLLYFDLNLRMLDIFMPPFATQYLLVCCANVSPHLLFKCFSEQMFPQVYFLPLLKAFFLYKQQIALRLSFRFKKKKRSLQMFVAFSVPQDFQQKFIKEDHPYSSIFPASLILYYKNCLLNLFQNYLLHIFLKQISFSQCLHQTILYCSEIQKGTYLSKDRPNSSSLFRLIRDNCSCCYSPKVNSLDC